MIKHWTQGYISDLDYDYNFFAELAPIQIAFSLLDAQYLPPSLEQFTYCELGCGQGFTTNVLAAANPQGLFWGIDFNPSHIARAQHLAQVTQLTNIQFLDHSFAELGTVNFPEFDFIVLHGIYSWINDDNRQIIIEFIRRKLKVGGVVYISYNALPGWSTLMPLRELMVQSTAGSQDSSLEKVEKALTFAETLKRLKAKYFLAHPTVGQDLEEMQEDSRIYLAHEYFNENSRPFYHSEIVEHLAAAKLTFAAPADIEDQFYNLALDTKQIEFLEEISNQTLQETIRDFFFNTRFRKDLFIKGSVQLSALEQVEWISKMRFILLVEPENISDEIILAGRALQLDHNIYTPLIRTLTTQPQTLRAMMKEPDLAPLGFASLCQALKILISLGHVAPALPEVGENDRAQTIAHFNLAILYRSRFGLEAPMLASPITGSGVEVNRTEQLFLLALIRGADPVHFTWQILDIQGEKLMKEDQVLESPEENQAELKQQFEAFERSRLPLLKRLGIDLKLLQIANQSLFASTNHCQSE